MSVIGTISVAVRSQHSQFVRGMQQSRKSMSRVQRQAEVTKKAFRGLGKAMAASVAVFTAGKLVSSIRETAAELDKLGKTADKLGVSTERLAGLRFGAEQSGLDSRTLDMALQRMVRRISQAAAEAKGEAVPALKELGLSAKRLSEMTPDQMLARVADKMAQVKNQSDRVRLAFKLFDSEGVNMVNL